MQNQQKLDENKMVKKAKAVMEDEGGRVDVLGELEKKWEKSQIEKFMESVSLVLAGIGLFMAIRRLLATPEHRSQNDQDEQTTHH